MEFKRRRFLSTDVKPQLSALQLDRNVQNQDVKVDGHVLGCLKSANTKTVGSIILLVMSILALGGGAYVLKIIEMGENAKAVIGSNVKHREFLTSLLTTSLEMKANGYEMLTEEDLEKMLKLYKRRCFKTENIVTDYKMWNFWTSFDFATTIVTTIGYGGMAPRTQTGKIFVIFYALPGMFLMMSYLNIISNCILKILKKLLKLIRRLAGYDRMPDIVAQAIVLCMTLCIMMVYFIIMSYLMHKLNPNDSFIKSFYFYVITMTTIGIGDITLVDHSYMALVRMMFVFSIGLVMVSLVFNAIRGLSAAYKRHLVRVSHRLALKTLSELVNKYKVARTPSNEESLLENGNNHDSGTQGMTIENATELVNVYHIKGTPAERFWMGTWSTITASMALFGNMTVLLASFKYNAIKLDKISTTLIKNIALADMGFSFYILSTLVTIIADDWVFGDLMCYITNYWHMFFGISEIYLICALNISKLHCLLFPLLARTRSARTGRIIALAMWSVMPLFYLIPALLLDRVVSFRPSYYRCEGFFLDPDIKFPFFASLFFIVLPMIVVCVAIVWLLFYIRGVTGIQKQSVLTLLLISSCYFGSYLPYGIYHIIKATVPNVEGNIAISIHLYRLALFMLYLNFSVNPFIYLLSVKSYKEFIIDSWNSVLKKKRASTSQQKGNASANITIASNPLAVSGGNTTQTNQSTS